MGTWRGSWGTRGAAVASVSGLPVRGLTPEVPFLPLWVGVW